MDVVKLFSFIRDSMIPTENIDEAFFPSAIDKNKVGTYSLSTEAGGGYVFDDVLEYRVWVKRADEDASMLPFAEYKDALRVYNEATDDPDMSEDYPHLVVLVKQNKHIDEPQTGQFRLDKELRITEWQPEWLEGAKSTPALIKKIMSKGVVLDSIQEGRRKEVVFNHSIKVEKLNEAKKKKKTFKSVKTVKIIDHEAGDKKEWESENSIMQCQDCGGIIEGFTDECSECKTKNVKNIYSPKKKTKETIDPDKVRKEILDIMRVRSKRSRKRRLPEWQCQECGKTWYGLKKACPRCKSEDIDIFVKESKSKLKEQEGEVITIVAKGIADKRDAERLAREKDGKVVTDDADEKKFMVIVKESISEQIVERLFTSDVKLSLNVRGAGTKFIDYELMTESVPLSYRIDIEERSWGIKDIAVSFTRPVEIVWSEYAEEGDEKGAEHKIEVDMIDANIIWEKGNVYSPSLLNVEVDENDKVTTIDVYFDYIDKSY